MQLTIGETAAVEDMARCSIEALQDKTAPKGRLIAALVVVISRRTDPTFTLDQAYAMPADAAGTLVESFFGPDDADPLGEPGPSS